MKVSIFVHHVSLKPSLLLLIVLLSCSCDSNPEPEVCREFFSKSSDQAMNEFVNYELAKQLTIDRCRLERAPFGYYSSEISRRGEVIIPELLHQLNRTDFANERDAELTKFGVILIFRSLAAGGDSADDPYTIAIIKRSVSEIETDWMRSDAEDSFAVIQRYLVENSKSKG